jgi:anhydro-N-acetylmuramic acid kinase
MLPEGERARLLAFLGGHAEPPSVLAELDRDLAIAAAATGETLLRDAGARAEDLRGIGWSGQTIALQAPDVSNRLGGCITLGSPAVLARRLGRPVAANFLASDLAAGGCGGPIEAWADWLLFRDERLSRVALHLGGMVRLTFIPADADPMDVRAWEVGPGTMVLDALAHKFHHRVHDTDGGFAAGGKVSPSLLNELQAHPYFQVDPPKRANPAEWGKTYIWRLLQMAGSHKVDEAGIIATVTELLADQAARAVASLTERPHEIILTGGGALNIHLAGRIRKKLSPSSTYTVERYGYGIRSKQAVCMAVLAAARLDAFPAHCPPASNATAKTVLGSMTRP